MVKLQSVFGSPTGPTLSGWGALSPRIVNFWFLSGKARNRHPCFIFSLQQVPTPEGKQHTEGQQGQSSVWTQPLPTDRACQSLDLTCLECREELSHRGTWAWHHVKLWGRDCHRKRDASCKTCALIRRPLFRRACVLEVPPAKGQ